jgi:hypothetical protein
LAAASSSSSVGRIRRNTEPPRQSPLLDEGVFSGVARVLLREPFTVNVQVPDALARPLDRSAVPCRVEEAVVVVVAAKHQSDRRRREKATAGQIGGGGNRRPLNDVKEKGEAVWEGSVVRRDKLAEGVERFDDVVVGRTVHVQQQRIRRSTRRRQSKSDSNSGNSKAGHAPIEAATVAAAAPATARLVVVYGIEFEVSARTYQL